LRESQQFAPPVSNGLSARRRSAAPGARPTFYGSLNLGFDPEIDDMETREHPSEDLHDAYGLVGLSYTKKEGEIERTVGALDFEQVRKHLRDRVPRLRELLEAIEGFLKSRSN